MTICAKYPDIKARTWFGAGYGGLHITSEVADRQMDVILNLKCNSRLPKESAINSTCCNGYGKPSWVQCLLLTLSLGILPLITALVTQRELRVPASERMLTS